MFKLRLKELRDSQGISQKQLSVALNISQGAIGNWESGTRNPNSEYIKKLAAYFDVTTDYLLGINDKQHNRIFKPEALEADIINELSDLTDEKKQEVLNFIKFVKTKK